MSVKCRRCGKDFGESIVRNIGEDSVFNIHITEFSGEKTFGKQLNSINLCNTCNFEFELFLDGE